MERTILIVEDSPTQAERLTWLLEGEGYRVGHARNGREGLERAQSSAPDLIISDVVMPEMDGYALCRALKARKITKRIPIVLLTSRKSAVDVIKGLEHGADNFITKPFEDEYLLERVRRIFEHLDLRRKGHLDVEVTVRAGEREFVISADKQQIVELLFSTYGELCTFNAQLEESRRQLEEHARTLEVKVAERTRELRTLFEGVPVALFVTTPAGRIVDVNPAAVQMLGFPDRASLLATNMGDIYADPEDRRRFSEAIGSQGIVRGFETRFRRHDGAVIWVRFSVRALRDDDGRIHLYEGAIEDITEAKRAEEGLRLLEALTAGVREAESLDAAFAAVLRKVCETAGFAYGEVWQPALDQTHLELSPAWYALTPALGTFRSLTSSVTVGRNEGLPGHVWVSREPLWIRDASEDPTFRRREAAAAARLKAGMAIPILAGTDVVSVMVFFGLEAREEDSRLIRLLAAAASQLGPVVQRKRAEDALRQTEKLASMGYLLAGIAHELNNPLSVLVGQTALLREKAPDDTVKQRADKIAAAADRCARIVKNFLALARQQPTDRQPMNLNQVVTEALELLAYQIRVNTIEVTMNLADDIPTISADPNQLHQIMVNLVTNAQQAMRKSPPRRLSITTRHDGSRERVVLEVEDNGPGIPHELQAKIFEPFFTTKPPGEGTGLGLSLTRTIIEEHGGALRLRSEADRGTTFTIELPTRVAPEAGKRTPAAAPAQAPSGRTVLVVDDEPEIAAVLAEMLQADGHQVETVHDGARALERLRQQAYDLVLSDLRMPNVDGPTLYRKIQELRPGLERRFIFLTGDLLSPETRSFVEQSGAPTIGKPFALSEVRRAFARALGTSEPGTHRPAESTR